jgi:hypothetical protein
MEKLGEEIELSILKQSHKVEEDEEELSVENEEMMMVSGQVMAALCSLGGFTHTVYAGRQAKVTICLTIILNLKKDRNSCHTLKDVF